MTVIDHHNYHTFLQLLYQMTISGPSSAYIAYLIRDVLQDRPGMNLRMGTITAVEPGRRVVTVDNDELGYNQLVIAVGSRAHFFGVLGAEGTLNVVAAGGGPNGWRSPGRSPSHG